MTRPPSLVTGEGQACQVGRCSQKWPYNLGTHGVMRAAKTADSTAVRPRSMVRMGAGRCLPDPVERTRTGGRAARKSIGHYLPIVQIGNNNRSWTGDSGVQ